jgi:hypothetical protein
MLIEILTALRNKIREACSKSEPYLIAFAGIIIQIIFGCLVYIYDALRNFVIRARGEPFIALAAAATVIYAIFAYGQWSVMSGQLYEMRNAASSDRAWLFITHISAKPASDDVKNKSIAKEINFDIGNFGKAPATLTSITPEILFMPGDVDVVTDPDPDRNSIFYNIRNGGGFYRNNSRSISILNTVTKMATAYIEGPVDTPQFGFGQNYVVISANGELVHIIAMLSFMINDIITDNGEALSTMALSGSFV